jgi:N-acetylmuramic acid 6-phosphate etherase
MGMERPQTETTLANTVGIDTWEDARILDAMIAGQERAIAAVRAASPKIAQAAASTADRIAAGGRLIYAGAGTSIRIGVQDGSELPATFGMAEDKILYCIAGGRAAMFDTLADAEDDAAAGARDAAICKPGDVMIAIAASGTTTYTIAAAAQAKRRGAFVISVVNNPDSPLGALADSEIVLNSGPEIISGSTRMGAGTAQKVALNLLSTLIHIKLGAVHDGMMVNVQADNAKLKRRAAGIISRITGVDEMTARAALERSAGQVKSAILICAGAITNDAAQRILSDANGNLRLALSRLSAP